MAVHYECSGGVATVTIDRPERRNAVDLATADALAEAWRRFDMDDQALVGILVGAGGTFCAGADLRSFDLIDRPEGPLGMSRLRVGKPTIAAVAGYCVAGGLELALWCDLRVAGAEVVFGCFERRFGVPLIDGGTQRLPRLIGLGRALDMILTGRPVGAEEALSMGLVDRVVEKGGHVVEARQMAARIASFPQETVRSDRNAVLDGIGTTLEEGLEIERRHGLQVWDVAARGARRFAEGEGRHGAG